jgi:hypothetical protein
MANDGKKTKAEPAPKKEAAAKDKGAPAAPEKTATAKEPAKPTAAAAPADLAAGYSRGEGQKPVSQAYKDNWNAIFGKKKKKR